MTRNRSSDAPPQSPQHQAELQQSVAEPLFFPPLDSKKNAPLCGFGAFDDDLCFKMNCSLTPFLCELYAKGSQNNSRELNLEIFILGIYLAHDHRPGTCQPF